MPRVPGPEQHAEHVVAPHEALRQRPQEAGVDRGVADFLPPVPEDVHLEAVGEDAREPLGQLRAPGQVAELEAGHVDGVAERVLAEQVGVIAHAAAPVAADVQDAVRRAAVDLDPHVAHDALEGDEPLAEARVHPDLGPIADHVAAVALDLDPGAAEVLSLRGRVAREGVERVGGLLDGRRGLGARRRGRLRSSPGRPRPAPRARSRRAGARGGEGSAAPRRGYPRRARGDMWSRRAVRGGAAPRGEVSASRGAAGARPRPPSPPADRARRPGLANPSPAARGREAGGPRTPRRRRRPRRGACRPAVAWPGR